MSRHKLRGWFWGIFWRIQVGTLPTPPTRSTINLNLMIFITISSLIYGRQRCLRGGWSACWTFKPWWQVIVPSIHKIDHLSNQTSLGWTFATPPCWMSPPLQQKPWGCVSQVISPISYLCINNYSPQAQEDEVLYGSKLPPSQHWSCPHQSTSPGSWGDWNNKFLISFNYVY